MVVKIKKIIKILFIPIFLIFTSINYGCSPASVLATGGGSAMVVAIVVVVIVDVTAVVGEN